MSRFLSFALFITVALSIMGLAHYYIWVRLVRDAGLPRAAFRTLTVGIVVMGLSIPATFWASRAMAPGPARGILLVTFSWMGLLLFFVVLLLGAELFRFCFELYHRVRSATPDPERRLTLARMLSGAVTVGVAVLGGMAVTKGLQGFLVKRVEIPLERLPKALDGFTIVQLTDLHIGPTLQHAFLDEVVRRVNALSPDLVAITGDLVDGSVENLGPIVERLKDLRSGHGTFFVTGNHEYYSGAADWTAYLRGLGIRVLENERVEIGQGENGFDLAGVTDHSAGRIDPDAAPNYQKALERPKQDRELILLAHQPKAVFDAEPFNVGLILSGHTHGGQFWPWNHFVPLQQPVVAGLERIGRTLVYVSCGTGYWGPPMRLGTTAEITQIVLRATA